MADFQEKAAEPILFSFGQYIEVMVNNYTYFCE